MQANCYAEFQRIKGRRHIHLVSPPSTAATMTTMTDRHRQAYNYVLLQIAQNLGREHVKKLCRFYTGPTPIHDTEPLKFFRCLEHEGRISWEDVDFLRDLMRKIRRFDLVKKLIGFEVKRDLTILLDFYVRKRQGLDLSCCSVPVKKVAGCLTRLTEIVRDRLDVATIIIPVKSSKDIRSELVDFEEEMDCRQQTFSWNEFTMLVIIAGELLAIASASEACSEPVMELCSTAADELSSRMIELGSWKDFCHQVKERYNLVYHQLNFESNPSLSLQRQRAEMIQRLAETIFSPVNK